MLFLTNFGETFKLTTGAALSGDWAAGWVDLADAGATPGSAQGNVSTATTTPVVTSPDSGVQRQLKSFLFVNRGASAQTVTFQKDDGAIRNLTAPIALQPNESLEWVDSIGWRVLDATGAAKNGTTGPGYLATSTSSLTVGTGSKAFTTQTGLAYSVGARVRATSTGSAAYMEGLVASYVGSLLTVTVDRVSGSGTQADWTLNIAGDPGAGASAGSTANGGRLTLATGTPVPAGNVTGASTIYWAPYLNDQVSLWDGTNWTTITSAQVSLAIGTVTNGLPYDIFGYLSSGALVLEKLAWSSASARATALALTDGRYTKTGDKTRLYLGTFHSDSTSTTQDSDSNRLVWNYFNRVLRRLYNGRTGGSASHSYNGGYRNWNNSGNERVQFIVGVLEDVVCASIVGENGASAGVYAITGMQLDGSSAPDSYAYSNGVSAFSAGGSYSYLPAAGFHYIQALESSASSGSATFVNYFLTGAIKA